MNIYVDFYTAVPKSSLQKYNGGGKHVRIFIDEVSRMQIPDLSIILFCPEWYEPTIDNEPILYGRNNIIWERKKRMSANYKFESDSIIFNPVLCRYKDFKELPLIKKKNPNCKVCAQIHDLRVIDYVFDRKEKFFFSGIKKTSFQLVKLLYEGIYPQVIYKKQIKKCLREIDEIYTASNYSMQHILKNEKNARVCWYYQTTPECVRNNKKKTRAFKYILFVSGGRRLKNIPHALLGFAKFKMNNPENTLKLVITGIDDKRFNNLCKMKEIQCIDWKNDIIHYNYLENEKLEELYDNCEFFLYTSTLEGFGLPVLEAAMHGKTSIASNRTSIPEVLAGAVRYVNPLNDEAIAYEIEYLCNSENRNRYQNRIEESLEIIKLRMKYEEKYFIEDVLDVRGIRKNSFIH